MSSGQPAEETYSPWTIVHLVFAHLADSGLHPVLGEGGDPSEPAGELLRSLGLTPSAQGDARIGEAVRQQLADLRSNMFDEP